jgi:3-oxoacyl-(acyl-carrier-protein) synthase/NAD(P)-dependent dehydrogenase (short-subunit alcohol dehydrogenase family)
MNRIAIVGMGGLFPGAATPREFWNNILAKNKALTPLKKSDGFWNLNSQEASIASASAGYLPEITFDPAEFGLPPASLDAISALQLLSLIVARDTLEDARLFQNPKILKRTGVILGVSGTGQTSFPLAARLDLPHWKQILENSGLPKDVADRILQRFENLHPQWREESFSGFLGNVVAGRIANRFDLGGTNYTVDAASASSLAAIRSAVLELNDGACDAVLAGGATVENSLFSFVCFSEIQALSKTGKSAPYDMAADGLLLGDGVGMVLLKRLEDAIRDEDTVYAVIQAVGSASDGRTHGVYSPAVEGQSQAYLRAYEKASFGPETVGLIEGHGTGTVLGDQIELKSLNAVFAKARPRSIALGSLKAQIGHSRAASGSASIIKAALALHHKVLPPVLHFADPHPELRTPECPFYLNDQPRAWIRSDKAPRRAAVNGFGFGGTNFHVVLEEFSPDHQHPYRLTEVSRLVVLHAPTPAELLRRCEALLEERTPAIPQVESIPATYCRLAFVVNSPVELARALELAILQLQEQGAPAWTAEGIWYRSQAASERVAVIFPEIEAVDSKITFDLALLYPEFREGIARANDFLNQHGEETLSANSKSVTKAAGLANATVFQFASFQVLRQCGLRPAAIVGVESGERAAICAAGGLLDENLLGNSNDSSETLEPTIPYFSARTGARVTNATELREILNATTPAPVRFTPVIHSFRNEPMAFLVVAPETAPSNEVLRTMAGANPVISLGVDPGGNAEFQFRQVIAQLLVAGVSLDAADPYRRAETTSTRSPSSVAVLLDGSFYFPPEFKEKRRLALEEKMPVLQSGSIGSLDLHGIHQNFQENQALYLKTLDQLFERYGALLERAKTDEERRQITVSLKSNAALLENNQASYFKSYESFLHRFGGDSPTPSTPVVPAPVSITGTSANGIHELEAPSPPSQDARQLILSVVSQKTGYPIEMLDLEMDLESDMGIDSINRIEIFTAIRDQRPELFVDLTTLEKMRTLRDILQFVESGPASNGSTPSHSANPAIPGALLVTPHLPVIERYAIHLKRLPSPDRLSDWLTPGGTWLVTDDGGDLAAAFAADLQALGAAVTLLRFPQWIEYSTPTTFSCVEFHATDEQSLREKLAGLLAEAKSVRGFVHLHPRGEPARSIQDCFRSRDYPLLHAVYFLAKHLSEPLARSAADGHAYFGVVTRLDGRLGLGGKALFPAIPAGLHGLAKSLRFEWPLVICKALDLAPALDRKTASENILRELANSERGQIEIGLDAESRWTTQAGNYGGESVASSPPNSKNVFVVSGGARGIVAECVVAAAKISRSRFILIGRTARPAPGAPLNAAQKEIQSTLDRVHEAGGAAIYLSADITRREELQAALASVKDLENITGLIHTAALIADKPIERKTEQDFRSVLETKVLGLDNLLHCLPVKSLRHVWLFSSIAGYFGNVGQTDYSMANEVLNKFAGAFIASGKDRTATTINWGPWNGGMLNDTLKDYYRRITGLVEPDQVIRYFLDEFTSPGRRHQQLLVNGFAAVPKMPRGKKPAILVTHREIAAAENPFLSDYRPGARPVLPDMCAAQWMTQAATGMAEGYRFSSMHQFTVYKKIVFDSERVSRRIECVPSQDTSAERPAADVKITNDDATLCYYSARVEFTLNPEEHHVQLSMLPDTNFKTKGRALYSRKLGLFQGPLFRGVAEFPTFDVVRLQADCRLAAIPESSQGQFRSEIFNPFLADVFLQPASVWHKHFQLRHGVLSGVDLIQQFRTPEFDQSCTVYTFITARTKNTVTAEIIVVDREGNTVMRFAGARFASRDSEDDGSRRLPLRAKKPRAKSKSRLS